MSPSTARLIRVFCLVGLAASLASLYVHYQLLANPSYSSFCDVNATVSCTQAYLSRFGSVQGVPVALFGVLWFAFILLLSFVAGGLHVSRETSGAPVLFALSLPAVPVIGYFAYAAFVVLRVVCVLCLTTYAAVLAVVVTSGLACGRPMKTLPQRFLEGARALASRGTTWLLALAFATSAASAVAFFPRESALRGAAVAVQTSAAATGEQRSEFDRWYESLPRVTVPVSADGAAVVVVKFSDLQCPLCSVTYFGYRPVLAKYQATFPGAVKLVVKDYPLQPDCNSYVLRPLHSAACDAAVAVRLARRHGKGEALEEWFYANQALMSPATVRDVAARVGGVPDFDQQYASVLPGLKADIGLAGLLGITGTPTFFINGARIPSNPALSPEQFDMAIAYELRKAGRMK